MNMELRVSEHWLNGFSKAAEATGLTPEQVPILFKIAQQLEARAADPETFDKGAEVVMKMEKVAINPLLLLALGGGGLLGGGLLAGGAALGLGGRKLLESYGRNTENKEFLKRLRQTSELNARNRTQQVMLGALPSMSGGMGGGGYGGGMGGGYGRLYPY